MRTRRAPEDEIQPNHKRPRVLIACLRCKSRRQKCDNASPSCSNCAGAGAECVFTEKAYPASYVKMLEEKIAALECRNASPNVTQDVMNEPRNMRNSEPSRSTNSVRGSSQLTLGFGVLSSCAASEPHYFGFSAGLSLAHFMQIAMDSGRQTGSQVTLPILADRPFANQLPNAETPLATLPSYSIGKRFIRAYLSTTHRLYPFLDKTALWELHRRHTLAPVNSNDISELDLAVLHLVYAIGSRCMQLTDTSKVGKDVPEGHFLTAMKHVPNVVRFTSIRSIEIVLLLILHSMRSPSGGSVWHLSGLAIRQCLELGLHKQRVVDASHLFADQLRKRMFWSAFILERKTALVLGRPFSVSENEVDVDLPFEIGDDNIHHSQHEIARTNCDSISPVPYSSISLHVYHILMYQIHTRIRQTVHNLKNNNTRNSLEQEISTRFQELDNWKKTFSIALAQTANTGDFTAASSIDSDESGSECNTPEPTNAAKGLERERVELLLEYHKAKRSLLQPLMTEGHDRCTFQAFDFEACATSSGQICQLYRKLNRLSAHAFTLRDLHAVFIAGFTLIYCISIRPSLHNVRCASDIGACSAVLHTIAGQWTSAKKYRDAFETVAEAVLERTRKNDESDSDSSSMPYAQHSAAHFGSLHQAHSDHDHQPRERNINTTEFSDDTARDPDLQLPSHDHGLSNITIPIDWQEGSDLDDLGGLLFNEGMDWFTSLIS